LEFVSLYLLYRNVAAVSGDKDAAKGGGLVAKRMTPSQLEKPKI
jgi:hypothetical protein